MFGRTNDSTALQINGALRRGSEPGNEFEQCRFAAPTGPDNANKLATFDRETYWTKRMNPARRRLIPVFYTGDAQFLTDADGVGQACMSVFEKCHFTAAAYVVTTPLL